MNWNRILGIVATAGLFVSQASAQSVNSLITSGLLEPHSIVVAPNGNYYLTDRGLSQIKQFVPSTGGISVLAGDLNGDRGSDDGIGILATFRGPEGIVFARGGLVVADSGNHTIRLVGLDGVVSTLAGSPGLFDDGMGSVGPIDSTTATDARFRFPAGLAVDAAGHIYVADALNDAIRKIDKDTDAVTTVATKASVGLFQPNAIAVDENSDLWVADTRNHLLKLIKPDGTLLATVGSGQSGSDDSIVAGAASFNLPRGLVFLSPSGGVLVSDTGNNTIRRVFANAAVSSYSVQTIAGIAGMSGRTDGATNAATFNAPIGLASDIAAGTVLVVDSAGPALAGGALRLIQTSDPLPKISSPQIGILTRITNLTGVATTKFTPVVQSVFNNEEFIAIQAEDGVETTFTFGSTPDDPFSTEIGDPIENDDSPPLWDGGFNFPSVLISPVLPDLTIKVRSFAHGRMASDVVVSRFQFKTANPSIKGDNAASFMVNNITTNAQTYYTIDGTDPPATTDLASAADNVTRVADSGEVRIDFGDSDNVNVKFRAYAPNFEASGITSKQFSRTNFTANKIIFGFEGGEGSSKFVGASGQRFYAPVTLDLIAGTSINAMQFTLAVTNITPAPMVTAGLAYQTLLEAQVPDTDPPVFVPLPPSMAFTNSLFFQFGLTNLVVTNTTFTTTEGTNFMSVGYLARQGSVELYDTGAQDLIAFSRAHNNRFPGDGGKVLVGAFGFTVPAGASVDDKYRIAIRRPSAVVGLETDVLLIAPTDGGMGAGLPVNAVKEVTVGEPGYIVGDSLPFGWYNAGDFGDTNILANDLLQVFQAAIYSANVPPAGSDFFDSMDSSDGEMATPQSFDGLDSDDIDGITLGDGALNIDDVYVTFRRATDPTLKWYRRFWSGGVRMVEEVPNQFRGDTDIVLANTPAAPVNGAAKANTPDLGTSGVRPFVQFTAGDAVPVPGLNKAQIPITAKVKGDFPIRTMMLNLNVLPLEGAPMISTPIEFIPGELGEAGISSQRQPWNYAGVWLNAAAAGLSGEALIGTLVVTLPAGVDLNTAYAVSFEHISGSPNGHGVMPKRVRDGLVTLRDRSESSLGDDLPDSWRLRHFGTLFNLLSHEDADADGDGVSNWAEFRAGTHPNDPASALKLRSGGGGNGMALRWPTVDGKKYVVECSSSMLNGEWTVISDMIDGDGDDMEFSDTSEGGVRFYRVRLVPESE